MTPNPPRTAARRVGAALGLAAVIVGSSCSSGGEGKASPSTPASTSPTTAIPVSVPLATEAAVLDGYRAFWTAFLHAGDPMDPQSPGLTATATGEQLEQVQRAFLARLSSGEVIRGTIETHPHVEGPVQSAAATVVDCYADDSHVFDAESGVQKDDPAVVHDQVRADLVVVDGAWRVAAIHHEATGCTPS